MQNTSLLERMVRRGGEGSHVKKLVSPSGRSWLETSGTSVGSRGSSTAKASDFCLSTTGRYFPEVIKKPPKLPGQ